MAKQIIHDDPLVPKFHSIGRCNNYDVLQNIPLPPKCKIVGQLLLDHPLSYALTATVDVPAVYLQQFWKTVSEVPHTKDTIKFKLDRQEIVYIVDINGTSSRSRIAETSDGLAAIQAQINNLGREIKKRPNLKESLTKFMTAAAKRHEENSNIIKEIQASTEASIRNQGASVSVMPFSTYTNLGLGILSHTRLTIELADRTIKQPRGIAKNMLVRTGFTIIDGDDVTKDIVLDMKFCKKYAPCQIIMKKFALGDMYERINDE
nr:hypothetical protein [Tanacetum cinerariifolium]